MSSPPKIVFGTGSIGDRFTGASAQEALDLFRKHGHVEIDTAAVYPMNNPGASETEIGRIHPDWAQVSTKVTGGIERGNSREKMQQSLAGSLERLNGLGVDVFYFHVPDLVTPMEEQAKAMDEAFKAGKFKRFGISNFSPEQVEELVGIAEREGYVKPSVLQGQYNLLARKGEDDLLPVLRKHGIAYYAYSPAAAGMLTGKVSRENSKEAGSRWSNENMGGQIYSASYHKDAIFEASQKVQDAAKEHGFSGHATALRWCIHHSALSGEHGDAVIVGASSIDQLKENLEICDAGPLPEELVKTIDGVWPSVKDVAPWAYFAQLGA